LSKITANQRNAIFFFKVQTMSILNYAVHLITSTTEGLLKRFDEPLPRPQGAPLKPISYAVLPSYSDSMVIDDTFRRWKLLHPEASKFSLDRFGNGIDRLICADDLRSKLRGTALRDLVARTLKTESASLWEPTFQQQRCIGIRQGVEWTASEGKHDGRDVLRLFSDEKKLKEILLKPWHENPRVVPRREAEALECRPTESGDGGKWRVVHLPGFRGEACYLRHWLYGATKGNHGRYQATFGRYDGRDSAQGVYLWIRDGTDYRDELPLPRAVLYELDLVSDLSNGKVYVPDLPPLPSF
jgi:hypothetical protein